MLFLLKYLEQKWSIKKRKDTYILKRANGTGGNGGNGCKMSYTASYFERYMESIAPIEVKQVQLLTFLHNALEDGWNIKKHPNDPNKYVFMKKHNGRCEIYEDDEYLTQFIKSNLQLES